MKRNRSGRWAFDEVRAAILPDNTSRALIDSLKETGIDVKLYKAGDDAQRTALLNKVPNVRFQLAEQAERDALEEHPAAGKPGHCGQQRGDGNVGPDDGCDPRCEDQPGFH